MYYIRPLIASIAMTVILSLISGCQMAPQVSSLPVAQSLSAFPSNWQASGRIGAFTKEHGGSLGFQLKNSKQSYQLRFLTPTGGQAALLEGDMSLVTLLKENGEQEQAHSPEALLEKHLGWSVPVLGLRYWLLGLADPEHPVEAFTRSKGGHLIGLQQNGWKIKFENYIQQGYYFLPTRLALYHTEPTVKIKIAINHWNPL